MLLALLIQNSRHVFLIVEIKSLEHMTPTTFMIRASNKYDFKGVVTI